MLHRANHYNNGMFERFVVIMFIYHKVAEKRNVIIGTGHLINMAF